jgi:hypothetical protein
MEATARNSYPIKAPAKTEDGLGMILLGLDNGEVKSSVGFELTEEEKALFDKLSEDERQSLGSLMVSFAKKECVPIKPIASVHKGQVVHIYYYSYSECLLRCAAFLANCYKLEFEQPVDTQQEE